MGTRGKRPYSGRLIFDHFPKTAGQAINRWLAETLGDGTVSPNLVGNHRDLISHAGNFPVLSGHVTFVDGEGLDPRYQYATIVREPIDRALSWLYFVKENHTREQLPQLYAECEAFIESEGDACGPLLRESLFNSMTAHFASILGKNGSADDDLVEVAFQAVQQFDCVGVYDRLNDFTAALASLIRIPAPPALQSVNVTAARPAADQISPRLKANLLAMTDLDRKLYDRISGLVDERLANNPPSPPKTSSWVPYRTPERPSRRSEFFVLHSATIQPGTHVRRGGVMRLAIDFELFRAVDRLVAGLHILDDRERWAFGINSQLLNERFENLPSGRHRLVHTLTADLPAGNYTVGFSFSDLSGGTEESLFWQDRSLPFEVYWPSGSIGVGYSCCYAEMSLERLGNTSGEDRIRTEHAAA